ncbi:MAG: hypothetical protein R3194_01690 [Limnobacter sp.]|nr:hypothetical protein [Limnobacter sp.]
MPSNQTLLPTLNLEQATPFQTERSHRTKRVIASPQFQKAVHELWPALQKHLIQNGIPPLRVIAQIPGTSIKMATQTGQAASRKPPSIAHDPKAILIQKSHEGELPLGNVLFSELVKYAVAQFEPGSGSKTYTKKNKIKFHTELAKFFKGQGFRAYLPSQSGNTAVKYTASTTHNESAIHSRVCHTAKRYRRHLDHYLASNPNHPKAKPVNQPGLRGVSVGGPLPPPPRLPLVNPSLDPLPLHTPMTLTQEDVAEHLSDFLPNQSPAESSIDPSVSWSASQKKGVVLAIMKRAMTTHEAAEYFNLPVGVVQNWLEAAHAGLEAALDAIPPAGQLREATFPF